MGLIDAVGDKCAAVICVVILTAVVVGRFQILGESPMPSSISIESFKFFHIFISSGGVLTLLFVLLVEAVDKEDEQEHVNICEM